MPSTPALDQACNEEAPDVDEGAAEAPDCAAPDAVREAILFREQTSVSGKFWTVCAPSFTHPLALAVALPALVKPPSLVVLSIAAPVSWGGITPVTLIEPVAPGFEN